MPLPWILGAAAVATATYLFSDDEKDKANERRREENREARREANRQREAFAAAAKARKEADELQAAQNMAQQFFQQYYGQVPQSIRNAQDKYTLKVAIKQHSALQPASLKTLTQKLNSVQTELDTIAQLIATLNTLKGNH